MFFQVLLLVFIVWFSLSWFCWLLVLWLFRLPWLIVCLWVLFGVLFLTWFRFDGFIVDLMRLTWCCMFVCCCLWNYLIYWCCLIWCLLIYFVDILVAVNVVWLKVSVCLIDVCFCWFVDWCFDCVWFIGVFDMVFCFVFCFLLLWCLFVLRFVGLLCFVRWCVFNGCGYLYRYF